MRSLASALVLLAACGTEFAPPVELGGDDAPGSDITAKQCETSYLDYANFAAAFSADWCRGCHGAAVPEGMRQKAPLDVNFDSLDALRHWNERIRVRATGDAPTMPPAGGPSTEERALLAEWLACGARE
jgi:uncharacterized membrane protein